VARIVIDEYERKVFVVRLVINKYESKVVLARVVYVVTERECTSELVSLKC
jgi:hypothetical protein